MKNKIIYDVFTDSEIEDIYRAVDVISEKTQVQEFLGRTRVDYEGDEVINLPKSITNKIIDLFKSIDEKYVFRYFTYVEYNNKYGKPQLGPHKDQTGFTATINYQLESNIDWDIYVEGIPYGLKDNSALILNVRDQDHWRPEKEFKDNEFLRMLFIHAYDPEDPDLNVVTPEQLRETNERWKHITKIENF